jgi:hypothetical protein
MTKKYLNIFKSFYLISLARGYPKPYGLIERFLKYKTDAYQIHRNMIAKKYFVGSGCPEGTIYDLG